MDVEVRASGKDAFGRGRKQRMMLRQLLAKLRGGSTSLYLSPQEVRSKAVGTCPRCLTLSICYELASTNSEQTHY